LIVAPCVRHDDGVAMSSRNAFLTPEQRAAAAVIPRALERARTLVEGQGVVDVKLVETALREVLEGEPLARVDYLAIVDAETLERHERLERETLIPVAAWFGNTRLIDNVIVRPRRAPRPVPGDAS
jgi:pantoate--beta-alanine ligase